MRRILLYRMHEKVVNKSLLMYTFTIFCVISDVAIKGGGKDSYGYEQR